MKPTLVIAFAFFAVAMSAPQGDDDGRIVNGNKATNTPYLCGVLLHDSIWCGCSVIDKRYVLTAAHCFPANASPSDYKVSVGSLEWQAGQHIPVQRVIAHDKFNVNGDLDNDICLLKLDRDIVYTNSLRPIALPSANSMVPIGQSALVSGYGYTRTNGYDMQSAARQVRVPVLSDNDSSCNGPYRLTANNFCAGNNGAAKADSCQGDSGGPLECNNQLIGIVSYGGQCNDAYAAGVYTKVSNYISWIATKKNFYGY